LAQSTSRSTVRPLWTRGFGIAVILAVVARQWLTADFKRLPLGAPYDEANYVLHARGILDGTWFGPYTDITLIKGPFYPIFMALVSDFGLPLHIAETLLYLAGCLIAVAAVAPLVRAQFWRITLFLALFFNPMSFESTTSRALRGNISAALALMVIGFAIGIYLHRSDARRMLLGSVALGASLAAFLLTREEDIWIVPFVAVIVIAVVAASRDWRPVAVVQRSLPVGIVGLIVMSSYVAIASLNYEHYGWYTPIEVTSTEFTSAYGALARIEPPASDRAAVDPHVPVRMSSLEEAYRVSPAARELKPFFSGPSGQGDIKFSCQQVGVCDGIAAGWFLWAFRDAAQYGGHHRTGADAERYYATLAAQIDDACEKRLLRCRPNSHSLAPHVPLNGLRPVFDQGLLAVHIVFSFEQLGFEPGSLTPEQAVPALFRSVTGDKLTLDPENPTDHQLKIHAQQAIGRIYQILNPPLLAAAFVVLLFRLFLTWRERRFDDVAFIVLGLVGSSAILIMLLAIISAYSFPSITPEYMKPLYASMLLGSVFTISADARRWLLAIPRFEELRARIDAMRLRLESEVRPLLGRWNLRAEQRARLPYIAAGVVVFCLIAERLFRPAIVFPTAPAAAVVTPVAPMTSPATPVPKLGLNESQVAALKPLADVAMVNFDGAQVLKSGAWTPETLTTLDLPKGAPVKLIGWAADRHTMSSAAGVLVFVDGKRRGDATVDYGGIRVDVGDAFGKPAMRATAFSVIVSTANLSVGEHLARLGVVNVDRTGYFLSLPVPFTIK